MGIIGYKHFSLTIIQSKTIVFRYKVKTFLGSAPPEMKFILWIVFVVIDRSILADQFTKRLHEDFTQYFVQFLH